ncbi:MAG: DUF554 domain-containing protein [Opitutaceae bacterium]|nr:DUF554 domain-containing protein [Opitutaceae bacterium]
MIGTLLNVAGILIGVLAGRFTRPFSEARQQNLKIYLGVFTTVVGLRLTWEGLNGSFGQIAKQLGIVLLALTLGRLAGRGLHLQKAMNRLGQMAKRNLESAQAGRKKSANEGLMTGALLFCAAPLAVIGSVLDGLDHHYQPLLLKAVIDGLAAMAFVPMFGWGVLLAVIPLAAWQCGLTLGAQALGPLLEEHGLLGSVHATGGLLIFCVALIIFGLKKIELGDYLPALAVAPLLTWLWK